MDNSRRLGERVGSLMTLACFYVLLRTVEQYVVPVVSDWSAPKPFRNPDGSIPKPPPPVPSSRVPGWIQLHRSRYLVHYDRSGELVFDHRYISLLEQVLGSEVRNWIANHSRLFF